MEVVLKNGTDALPTVDLDANLNIDLIDGLYVSIFEKDSLQKKMPFMNIYFNIDQQYHIETNRPRVSCTH